LPKGPPPPLPPLLPPPTPPLLQSLQRQPAPLAHAPSSMQAASCSRSRMPGATSPHSATPRSSSAVESAVQDTQAPGECTGSDPALCASLRIMLVFSIQRCLKNVRRVAEGLPGHSSMPPDALATAGDRGDTADTELPAPHIAGARYDELLGPSLAADHSLVELDEKKDSQADMARVWAPRKWRRRRNIFVTFIFQLRRVNLNFEPAKGFARHGPVTPGAECHGRNCMCQK
jgi:hypothetical protein